VCGPWTLIGEVCSGTNQVQKTSNNNATGNEGLKFVSGRCLNNDKRAARPGLSAQGWTLTDYDNFEDYDFKAAIEDHDFQVP